MAIYVSMLRGINVGGHKRIKMQQLRACFEAIGLEQVETYIQSGNVVFKTGKGSTLALSSRIEARILSDFRHSVSVISRTVDEMDKTMERNPFLKERGIDPEKLHVTFLSEIPAPAALKRLAELTTTPDRSLCLGKEIYLFLPNGVSGSGLMRRSFDRALAVAATTRNWKTVSSLHRMCQDGR
jgi:uncharacterized protein (DUF1697 family)